MKPPRLLCALLPAALLAACDDETPPDTVDAGIQDYVAYFGLQQDRCREYSLTDGPQQVPALGVAVEQLDETSFSVPTRVVVYRTTSVVMKDWVSIDGDQLKLHKRYFLGGKELLYRPAVTLLRAPPRGNSKIESTARVAIYEAGNLLSNDEHTLRVDVFAPTEEPLPIGAAATGYQVSFDETPETTGRSELRFFVPGTDDPEAASGWAQIGFNFEPDESEPARSYKLQGVRELTDGSRACGSAP